MVKLCGLSHIKVMLFGMLYGRIIINDMSGIVFNKMVVQSLKIANHHSIECLGVSISALCLE
jgi:hypothetical protein